MKTIVTLLVSLVWSFSVNGFVTNGQSPRQTPTTEFDKLIPSQFKAPEPGGVLLVTPRGRSFTKKRLASQRRIGSADEGTDRFQHRLHHQAVYCCCHSPVSC